MDSPQNSSNLLQALVIYPNILPWFDRLCQAQGHMPQIVLAVTGMLMFTAGASAVFHQILLSSNIWSFAQLPAQSGPLAGVFIDVGVASLFILMWGSPPVEQ